MILRVIACCLIVLPVQASEWGRLFYTEQERRDGVPAVTAKNDSADKILQSQRFDGELQTPRGKVRWVNGQLATPPVGIKPGEVWHALR